MTLRNALMGVILIAFVLSSLRVAYFFHTDEKRNRMEETNKAIPVKVPLAIGVGTYVASLFVGFGMINLLYF